MLFLLLTFLRSSPPPNFLFSLSVSKIKIKTDKKPQQDKNNVKTKQNETPPPPHQNNPWSLIGIGRQTGWCAEWDFKVLSPNWDVIIKPRPSGLRDLCGRGGRKSGQSQRRWVTTKETVSSGHNMTRAYMSSETMTAQVQDSQTSRLKGTSRHKVPLQPGNYVQLTPARKGKISFLRWKVTGYSSHTPRQAPWQGVASHHKAYRVSFISGKREFC